MKSYIIIATYDDLLFVVEYCHDSLILQNKRVCIIFAQKVLNMLCAHSLLLYKLRGWIKIRRSANCHFLRRPRDCAESKRKGEHHH